MLMMQPSDNEPLLVHRVDELVHELAVETVLPYLESDAIPPYSRRGFYTLPDLGGPVHFPYLAAVVEPNRGETPRDYTEFRRLALLDELPLHDAPFYIASAGLLLSTDNGRLEVESYGDAFDDRPLRGLDKAGRLMQWLEAAYSSDQVVPLQITERALERFELVDTYLPILARERLSAWGTDGLLILDTYDQHHWRVIIENNGEKITLLTDWVSVGGTDGSTRIRRRSTVRFTDDECIEFQDVVETGMQVGNELMAHTPGEAGGMGSDVEQQAFLRRVLMMLELATEYDVVPAARADV